MSRFIHISGPWDRRRHDNRERAFRAIVGSHPDTSFATVRGDWSAASGFRAIEERSVIDGTAVLAANVQIAIGAVLALTDRGLRVPDGVSVSGIDDIPEAEDVRRPLIDNIVLTELLRNGQAVPLAKQCLKLPRRVLLRPIRPAVLTGLLVCAVGEPGDPASKTAEVIQSNSAEVGQIELSVGLVDRGEKHDRRDLNAIAMLSNWLTDTSTRRPD